MGNTISKLFFDRRDHKLLNLVNDVLEKEKQFIYMQKRFYPHFHPHGIKEMSESKGLRIAYSVIHLLDSLEVGKAEDRLRALQCLRDEVLSSAETALQKNTARVLLQIMKDLVRMQGNKIRQLELAHDFRMATSGKPRIVRKLLRQYHLLEMPEKWNHIAFDDHVHDANTKGRKSPTHLIMDAWIKGIRRLRVIYYNHIQPASAAELLEAAEIMGITVRVGIEFSARFRNKYAQIIWVPRGFSDPKDFLNFLAQPPVVHLMEEGRNVSAFQGRYVTAILDEFNQVHLAGLNAAFGLKLKPLDKAAFLHFVGTGQASLLHLAKYIHSLLLPEMKNRAAELRAQYGSAPVDEKKRIEETVEEMDRLDSEAIFNRYLKPGQNPSVPNPAVPGACPDPPQLMELSPCELVNYLSRLPTGYRITLNLSNLDVADVLEILYDCKERIDRLEIFNLKDHSAGKTVHLAKIAELQSAINRADEIALKRIIREIVKSCEPPADREAAERTENLKKILHNIAYLKDIYKGRPLESRIGSDSTGHSPRLHGMGFVVIDTLPERARREVRASHGDERLVLPIYVQTFFQISFMLEEATERVFPKSAAFIRKLPGMHNWGMTREEKWVVEERGTVLKSSGNVVTLGGVQKEISNGLSLKALAARPAPAGMPLRYIRTGLKNGCKILIGFIPAFLTFALTSNWWLLAYGGAFIWFGITGARNIIQSVLGGGGIRRSPLLRWNDYVSWERLSDSLFFTGFSVPLLDYVTKTLLLGRLLGIHTGNHPVIFYTAMALSNGLYLFSHNVFRGLPREAAVGNLFRSVLSIPVAIFFNWTLLHTLGLFGVVGATAIVQQWAAVITKAASDVMAGIIEGTADRANNIKMRMRDYKAKFSQIFEAYTKLELCFPESEVLELLHNPRKFFGKVDSEGRDMQKVLIINALDLLYFWMYQPRARSAFQRLFNTMSADERTILIQTQFILQRQREISRLFIDGIVGRNFSKSLAFYLDRADAYMGAMRKCLPAPDLPAKDET